VSFVVKKIPVLSSLLTHYESFHSVFFGEVFSFAKLGVDNTFTGLRFLFRPFFFAVSYDVLNYGE